MLAAPIRQRMLAIIWLLFFLMLLISWWFLLAMARSSGLNMVVMPVGPNRMPMNGLGVLLVMWAVMMLAMMGPTFVATMLSYERLIKSGHAHRDGWAGIVSGYFGVWWTTAGLLAALQTVMYDYGVVGILGKATVPWIQAVLLTTVGMYQFTRSKKVCQGICLSPTLYIVVRWKAGFGAGFRTGAGLGGYCVACCWGFMALGFVGGTMNLMWMGLATAIMILEKLPEFADWITKPVGLILVLGGVFLAFGAI